MAKNNKFSIKDLDKSFPNDRKCLEYIFNATHNRKCSCGGEYRLLATRPQFQCTKCQYQISPMVNTIFQKSTTPLTLWFHAIWEFSNAKSMISAKEMERKLGVTYKCAYRIMKLIRGQLGQPAEKLKGMVEIDDSVMGGKGNGGKYNENQKEVMAKKAHVLAAVQRGGQIRARVVGSASAEAHKLFLHQFVSQDHIILHTDGTNKLDKAAVGYTRRSVNHGKGEYVRGDIHINTLETWFSHVKRSVRGTFKSVSRRELQSYLDAFAFHYNNRYNDRTRFETLVSHLAQPVAAKETLF